MGCLTLSRSFSQSTSHNFAAGGPGGNPAALETPQGNNDKAVVNPMAAIASLLGISACNFSPLAWHLTAHTCCLDVEVDEPTFLNDDGHAQIAGPANKIQIKRDDSHVAFGVELCCCFTSKLLYFYM